MQSKNLSSTITPRDDLIARDEFVILPPTEMGKQETIGKRLFRARTELGLSAAQLRQRIFDDHRAEVGESTIRQIEKERVPNPGIKTVEFLALGCGLDPLEVIGLGLEDPPETDPGYRESQFAQLYKSYKKLSKEQRAFVDEAVEMLVQKIQRWR